MVVRLRPKPGLDEHVLNRLPRDLVPEPPHRLHDLGIAPAGLFPDPNDRLADAFLHAGTARLGVLRLGPLVRRVFGGKWRKVFARYKNVATPKRREIPARLSPADHSFK